MRYLQIDVYEYGTNLFLGQRFVPFKYGEKIVSNAAEINAQVDEVKASQ